MAKSKDELPEPLQWIQLLVNIARLAIYLAMFIFWLMEFVFNPSNNFDYNLLPGHIYQLAGVSCAGENQTWQIEVATIEKNGKSHFAKAISARQKVAAEHNQRAWVELRPKATLTFPCLEDGTQSEVALIWDVYPDRVYLRVHPQHEIWEVDR